MQKEDRGEWISEDVLDAMLDKTDELEKKLDKGVDDMTEAQYKRYEKLDKKIWDAL
jgi:hypothetical protein